MSVEQLTACDVYSFGLLLFELLHERRAFDADPPMAAFMRSVTGVRPPLDLPADLGACAHLIDRCWSHDPQLRPSMEAVCAMLTSANKARARRP